MKHDPNTANMICRIKITQVYSVWKPMIINENLNENPLCVYHIIRYTGFWFQSKVLLNSLNWPSMSNIENL